MKKLLVVLLTLLVLLMPVCATDATQPRLVDNGDLLDSSEEATLLKLLDKLSETGECDIVVVTAASLEGKSVEAAADDFYDYNYYGYGEKDSGILLLVSMTERKFATSTYGDAISIFNDNALSKIQGNFTPLLTAGEYFKAFETFAMDCGRQIAANPPGSVQIDIVWVIIALAVGLIVALIYTGALKSQLKSVRRNNSAVNYVRPNSMAITGRNDIFLYRNVSRVAKPKDNSSGGSSLRGSSSGRSHGGSSGSF